MSLSDTTETWLSFDNVLHRAVAVTVPRQEMLREAPFLAEFLQRSRVATALHHRGILAAFDSGEDGETPYLVTEYIGGEPLAIITRNEAPFDVDDVAILVEQLAAALDYAHQRGFVHGALTPADVIVDGQGAAKLFGLGIPSGSVLSTPGVSRSTPLTFDDDVQSMAAIAFEMLTGEQPDLVGTDANGAAYLIDPDIPRNASDIVSIGLGAGPVRFSSAGAFARSLSGWRTFNPGEYYVAPEATVEPNELDFAYSPATTDRTGPLAFDDWAMDDEPAIQPEPFDHPSTRGVRFALVAALLLALLAGILVWRSSDAVAGPTTALPPQVQSLAELAGF